MSDRAELFSTYFNSVNADDNGELPKFPRRAESNTKLDTVQFTAGKIYKVRRKLKPKMTCDPDGYSPFLVKQLVSAFVNALSLLFSSFFSIGRIPSSWKRAIITPIFKKGVSSNPTNYRPVSLTSVFGKVMERVVAADILEYLLVNKLL